MSDESYVICPVTGKRYPRSYMGVALETCKACGRYINNRTEARRDGPICSDCAPW